MNLGNPPAEHVPGGTTHKRKQKRGDLSVSFSPKPSGPGKGPVFLGQRGPSEWSIQGFFSVVQQSAPLHASSEKHSAYYQCAWLEVIYSASIISEATVAGYSLEALHGAEMHLIAAQDVINVIPRAHSIIFLLSDGMTESELSFQICQKQNIGINVGFFKKYNKFQEKSAVPLFFYIINKSHKKTPDCIQHGQRFGVEPMQKCLKLALFLMASRGRLHWYQKEAWLYANL